MSNCTPKAFPHSAIAYLHVRYECNCWNRTTGFLVGPDVMMTAAHCVFCPNHGKPYRTISAYFGYRSTEDYACLYDKGYEAHRGTSFLQSDGTYKYAGSTEDDYAYLKLEEPIGEKLGWFGLKAADDQTLLTTHLMLGGYSKQTGEFKTGHGRATHLFPKKFYYYIEAVEAGLSGAPLFTSDYDVVAIQVAADFEKKIDIAKRITRPLIDQMHADGMS